MFKTVLLLSIFRLALALPPKEINKIPTLDGRIVGGDSTTIDKYPYQVSLLRNGRHYCGGSIINTFYVVTAAHCTVGLPASSLTVRVGSSTRNSEGIVVSVNKVVHHPNYNRRTNDFDVSVLKLASPLPLGPNVTPILLQSSTEPSAGSDAVVTGWGALKEGGSLSSRLQAVTVQIVSRANCTSAYGQSKITNNMICAGVPNGGKDACAGDSGSPLVVNGKLAGIVSWGYGCARPNNPGVYSNVAILRNFIIEKSDLKF